jgi:tungstate transport system substrate-binding protein
MYSSNRSRFAPRRICVALVLGAAIAGLAGASACSLPWLQVDKEIILGTTTSVQDSGLLDALIPAFQAKNNYLVKPIAVGTGQALELGKQGEADVLIVHAPSLERPLVEEGYCIRRRLIMHSYFAVVGPETDAAGIAGAQSAAEAFKAIADASALFVSRGDDSGTHTMELGLWELAGVDPVGQEWYQETGSGMGQTLSVASEKDGYTLADRGTYLSRKATLSLKILFEGDLALLNVYHVMEVSREKYPKVNSRGAKAFADFLLSPAGQEIIRTCGVDKYGQPLFLPDAGKTEEQLGIK